MSLNFQYRKKMIYNEKYHDNCHDYLKKFYLEKYALPNYKHMLYEIKDKIPKIDICVDTDTKLYIETVVCDQHAVIFTKNTDAFPILSTYALNACIGLIMYIPTNKIACLAHIDGLPGYSKKSALNDGLKINFDPIKENMKIILNKLRTMATSANVLNIDYYLIGGIFDMSEIMIHDIIEHINTIDKKLYTFNFKGRNLLGPENQSRNISFNTNNGQITYFDYVINNDIYSKHRNDNGLAINIIKAPRTSEAILDITYEPLN